MNTQATFRRGNINSDFIKDFRGWHEKKSDIEYKNDINPNSNTYTRFGNPKKREIWLTLFGHNVGNEVSGKEKYTRPVLVLQRFGSTCVVLPLTTGGKDDKYHYTLKATIDGKLLSRVKLSHITTIDFKRLIKKMDILSQEEFNQVVSAASKMLGFTSEDADGEATELEKDSK